MHADRFGWVVAQSLLTELLTLTTEHPKWLNIIKEAEEPHICPEVVMQGERRTDMRLVCRAYGSAYGSA
jgi:hypothetical protein